MRVVCSLHKTVRLTNRDEALRTDMDVSPALRKKLAMWCASKLFTSTMSFRVGAPWPRLVMQVMWCAVDDAWN